MKWVVHMLGSPPEGYEISLIRDDYENGKESWGWYGRNKILLVRNGDNGNIALSEPIAYFLVRKHLETANEVCDLLNSEEDACIGMMYKDCYGNEQPMPKDYKDI